MSWQGAKDYVEVSERIQEFRAKHPDGTLQSEVVHISDSLVIVKGYAYRSPDDERPGTGLAGEPIPGETNFTKNSEVQNAETSAWGRAIIAVGAADAKRGIASADEVRNRRSNSAQPEEITDEQHDTLRRLIEKNGTDKDKAWLADAEEQNAIIPVATYDKLCARLAPAEGQVEVDEEPF